MTPDTFRKQIADGSLGPVYLIQGEDAGEKAALVTELAGSVEEGIRAFNVDRFYGTDAKAGGLSAILDAARTLPFGAPRRIVLVMQPEKLGELRRESEASASALAALERYLEAPSPGTTLVFVPEERLDGRTGVAKLLAKFATTVECGGVADPAAAAAWVRREVQAAGKSLEPASLRLLVQRAGLDVGRLRAEVDRVVTYVGERREISAADVEAVVGAAVSQDVWAMTQALERNDARSALRELALALDSGAVPYMVLGQLAWYARTKVPPARVRAAIEAVFRTDLDLKSSVGDPRVLLERLVVELSGPARRG